MLTELKGKESDTSIFMDVGGAQEYSQDLVEVLKMYKGFAFVF